MSASATQGGHKEDECYIFKYENVMYVNILGPV